MVLEKEKKKKIQIEQMMKKTNSPSCSGNRSDVNVEFKESEDKTCLNVFCEISPKNQTIINT